MVDTDIMFEALKLAWIPGLLTPGNLNWKTIPDYYPRRVGGLNFLLRCNYVEKYLASLPVFYGNILKYSRELKAMYYLNQVQNIILHNNPVGAALQISSIMRSTKMDSSSSG